jgi:peptide/nickel transport system substrate-binding protein
MSKLTAAGIVMVTTVCLALVVQPTNRGQAAPAKDDLIIGSSDDPTTLDVRFHTGRVGFEMLAPMYETLFRHDAKGNVTGWLAESWKWDTPQSLHVKLRKGVLFQDGQPLTARDVKYTLEAIANPTLRSRQQTYLNEVASIEVLNDTELIIHTPHASRALVRFLTYYGQIAPARAKIPNPTGIDLAQTPVGTGPFRFVEYVPGNRLVYERFDRYWGAPPKYRRLVFRIIREPATRAAALEARDVDLIFQVPSESRDILRQHGFKVDVAQTVAIYALTVETTTAPFKDIRARHAAAYAIDKSAVAKLYAPEAEVGKSILGPGVWGRREMAPYPYDPEKARQLLKDAGLEGAEISYVFDPANTDGSTTVPEAVGEYLRKAGFRVKMQAMERGTFNASVYTRNRNVHVWTWTWGVGTLDPEEIFRREFDSTRGAIWVSYKSALLDKLIGQAATEPDERRAAADYGRLQEYLWREATWIPLYNIVDAVGYRPDLRGLVQWPGGGLYWFDRITFGR